MSLDVLGNTAFLHRQNCPLAINYQAVALEVVKFQKPKEAITYFTMK